MQGKQNESNESPRRTLRWEDESWEQIGKIAQSVGLTRSEFIRRATLAAAALPHALSGQAFSPLNAASDTGTHSRNGLRKQAGSQNEGGGKATIARTALAGRAVDLRR